MPYLNFTEGDKSRCAYRILPADRFVSNLRDGENVLLPPMEWDDPFENVIMSAVRVLDDGPQVSSSVRDDFFAQCRSLHKETDLMWRGYSPENDGVKLKARIKTLYTSLDEKLGLLAPVACFLGRVEYQRRRKYKRTLKRGFALESTNEAQARTLLVKRYGFRSEREVRLIAYRKGDGAVDNRYRYQVDWNDLVGEVVLHPRMPIVDVENWRTRILAAGFRGKVFQSGLYKRPHSLTINVRTGPSGHVRG